jgi:predicted dehydrogenase
MIGNDQTLSLELEEVMLFGDRRAVSWLVVVAVAIGCEAVFGGETRRPIRVGIIGLDTIHAVAFTEIFNHPEATGPLAEVKVVAGYPGGSPDVPKSRDMVQGYTEKLRGMGVEIVDSIEKLLPKVDAVLLESLDGRPHLKQARPVIRAGKPIFVDKPLAASLVDAVEIFRLAQEHGVPCFSSSSLRYSSGIIGMRNDPGVGEVIGCSAYSPNKPLEPSHPDFYYYGIHGAEILFTIMGPGCKTVSRVKTEGTDLAVGVWEDGRVGTLRGIRSGRGDFGATVFGTKGIAESGNWEGYAPLLVEIAKFFQTGKAPVPPEETLAIYAFMEAADESKRRGGSPVSVEEVLEKARADAASRYGTKGSAKR